jgi:hypothetical protein
MQCPHDQADGISAALPVELPFLEVQKLEE